MPSVRYALKMSGMPCMARHPFRICSELCGTQQCIAVNDPRNPNSRCCFGMAVTINVRHTTRTSALTFTGQQKQGEACCGADAHLQTQCVLWWQHHKCRPINTSQVTVHDKHGMIAHLCTRTCLRDDFKPCSSSWCLLTSCLSPASF